MRADGAPATSSYALHHKLELTNHLKISMSCYHQEKIFRLMAVFVLELISAWYSVLSLETVRLQLIHCVSQDSQGVCNLTCLDGFK
jgi:hypothetical protein